MYKYLVNVTLLQYNILNEDNTMWRILVIALSVYAVAIASDVVFIQTNVLFFKVVYWSFLFLGNSLLLYFIIKNCKQK